MRTGDTDAGSGFAQGVVEIVGPDLDRSLAFYLEIGFTLLRRNDDFAVVVWQGQRLFLAENRHAPTAPRWVNLRIMVDDVDALAGRLAALGIAPLNPPADRHYGLRDMVLEDPRGFHVRFPQALTG